MVRAFESLRPADGIAFRLRSEIPLARGLGSSAAAIVAGLFAADHLFELGLSREEMLVQATELEGHPDNVAAAIYGGFVVCGEDAEAGRSRRGFDAPKELEGIVVIPEEEVSTERAREAIPAEIPLLDAVSNLSAVSQLVLGLQTRRPRSAAARGFATASIRIAAASSFPARWSWSTRSKGLGALGATISGAGPTVLVWTTWQDAGKVAEALQERAAGWAEVRRLPFSPHGADVPEL